MRNTTATAPVAASRRTGRNTATIVATVLAFLTLSGPAYATGGLLGGAETSFFDSIRTFLTGNLLPLVFVLAAVVIGAGMLIRYGRKAVSS